jgi:hypothetical protein
VEISWDALFAAVSVADDAPFRLRTHAVLAKVARKKAESCLWAKVRTGRGRYGQTVRWRGGQAARPDDRSIGLDREDVYIANIVKMPSANNRVPLPGRGAMRPAVPPPQFLWSGRRSSSVWARHRGEIRLR